MVWSTDDFQDVTATILSKFLTSRRKKQTEAAGRWRREAFLDIAQAGRGGKSPGSKPTEMDFTAMHLKAESEVWLLRLSRNAVSSY